MELYLTNDKGLTLDIMNDTGIKLNDIQGLDAQTTIATSQTADGDGETITSNKANKRVISIVLGFRKTYADNDVLRLYEFFRVKSNGTVYITKAGRNAKITYYVEKCVIPPNVHPLTASISLICPSYYFEALETNKTDLAGLISRFRLPFTIPATAFKLSEITNTVFTEIENTGDVTAGATWVFKATSEVINPSVENVTTGAKMQLNFTMAANDVITITTDRDNKRITLTRNGVETNLTNYKMRPFTFLQLAPGTSTYKRDADSNVAGLFITCYNATLWGAI